METFVVIHKEKKYSAINGEFVPTDRALSYVIHKLENGLAFKEMDDDGTLMFTCFRTPADLNQYFKDQIDKLKND